MRESTESWTPIHNSRRFEGMLVIPYLATIARIWRYLFMPAVSVLHPQFVLMGRSQDKPTVISGCARVAIRTSDLSLACSPNLVVRVQSSWILCGLQALFVTDRRHTTSNPKRFRYSLASDAAPRSAKPKKNRFRSDPDFVTVVKTQGFTMYSFSQLRTHFLILAGVGSYQPTPAHATR